MGIGHWAIGAMGWGNRLGQLAGGIGWGNRLGHEG